MDVVDLPLVKLREVPWNPNVMDDHMLARLKKSITRFRPDRESCRPGRWPR